MQVQDHPAPKQAIAGDVAWFMLRGNQRSYSFPIRNARTGQTRDYVFLANRVEEINDPPAIDAMRNKDLLVEVSADGTPMEFVPRGRATPKSMVKWEPGAAAVAAPQPVQPVPLDPNVQQGARMSPTAGRQLRPETHRVRFPQQPVPVEGQAMSEDAEAVPGGDVHDLDDMIHTVRPTAPVASVAPVAKAVPTGPVPREPATPDIGDYRAQQRAAKGVVVPEPVLTKTPAQQARELRRQQMAGKQHVVGFRCPYCQETFRSESALTTHAIKQCTGKREAEK